MMMMMMMMIIIIIIIIIIKPIYCNQSKIVGHNWKGAHFWSEEYQLP
jgi:hypothetical protein